MIEELSGILGCGNSVKLGRYLGVYVDDHKEQKHNFDSLLSKINNHLVGWRPKLLSQASRLTLIKFVLAADPVYPLSSFWAPKHVTEKIDSKFTNFFWGFNKEAPRMHLMKDDWPSHPKPLGGLGCRRTM